jgi:transcriptional regulator with XRE-family HTH domain
MSYSEKEFMLSTPKIVNALRLSRGLSVTELAKKMRCSRQTIYNWEEGVSEPKLSQFLHLCMIVGLSPNNLLPELKLTEHKDALSENTSTSAATPSNKS